MRRDAAGSGRFPPRFWLWLALLVAGFGAWRLESMPPRDPLGGGTPAGVRTGEGGALTVALIQAMCRRISNGRRLFRKARWTSISA